MKTEFLVLMTFLLTTGSISFAVDTLYVEPFKTDTSMADSKRKAKRIEKIPESTLLRIQEIMVEEIRQSAIFAKVHLVRPGETAPKTGQPAWILGGTFLDYKKGNKAVRYLVGFGAGKQKLEVQLEIRDAQKGTVVHSERIVDRKVAGIFGGNEDKGKRDFAERVVKLLRGIK